MKGKHLLAKILLLGLLVLGSNGLIRKIFNPSRYYGNEAMDQKIADFSGRRSAFNTLHIGSSCIFKNLNQVAFDSMMPREWKISSYNLGSGGAQPPETYWYVDQLLDRYPEGISNIIIELRDISLFPSWHRNTLRKRYWLTPGNFTFLCATQWYSNLPVKYRWETVLSNSESLTEKMMNIGYFNELFGKSLEVRNRYHLRMKDLQIQGVNGFLPINPQRERARKAIFLKDTTRLTDMAMAYHRLTAIPDSMEANPAHLRYILKLISRCESRGIHCVFVLHPKQDRIQWAETLALARHIPSSNLIDLSNPTTYPELYQVAWSMNYNHFNFRGTELFTRLCAEKFRNLHSQFLENSSPPNPEFK